MKKVAFYTLGCKVNQYETNGMIQKFMEKDYEIVKFEEFADIYIVNTCTVTNMSDRKSRQMLRRAKEQNKNSVIVAVGCYAQVEKENVEKIDEIDLVLGTNEKKDIVERVEKYFVEKRYQDIDDVFKTKEYSEFGNVTYTEKVRAVIKIQDGCDRFCSYCLIPYARGRIRSRKKENIINEINFIAQSGIKEVVITGIHIASYGKDFDYKYKLIDLLEEINQIEGIERIRLGSIEPLLITEDFVNRLCKLEKICHHFHLSLQSGCDETLKRMNRRYNTEEFENIIKLLRDKYDDVMFTTDIIVGFPGETDDEFNKTYNFLDKIKFYKMHIFKYSKRTGTKAAVMENQIPEEIKEKRSRELINLSNRNQELYHKKYIEKKVKVLVEEEIGNNLYKGHTANYIPVIVNVKNDKCVNQIIEVKCFDVSENEIMGGEVDG